MKIVALMENTSERADCCTEHGLSLYPETCGQKTFFDTGQFSAFAETSVSISPPSIWRFSPTDTMATAADSAHS